MTGRPLPTALKVFRGTAQKCRTNENEPMPSSDNILKPEMSAVASEYWDSLIPELTVSGIMTNIDMTALLLLCESYSTWIKATEEIRAVGLISGETRSPWIMIQNKAFDQMKLMLTEFGMTPSSRSRIKAEPKKSINDFDDF